MTLSLNLLHDLKTLHKYKILTSYGKLVPSPKGQVNSYTYAPQLQQCLSFISLGDLRQSFYISLDDILTTICIMYFFTFLFEDSVAKI